MNFYLLYGDDKALINKEIERLLEKLKLDDSSIIKYTINDIPSILEEAMTIGMFSNKKALIIDLNAYFTDKVVPDIDKLEEYFSSYNSDSYLIFYATREIDNRKKLVKLITSNGKVTKVEPTSSYLTNYINECLKENNFKMNSLDITYFLTRSGNNIDNITNELNKLMIYKENDKTITRDDINLLVSDSLENSVYDLVNAILKDDKVLSEKLYNKFMSEKVDISSIINLLASQFRLLFQVKRLYNSGKTKEEIASILDIKNIYRINYLINDSYKYTDKEFIKYLSKLATLDKDIKSGNVNEEVFLELFIIKKDM